MFIFREYAACLVVVLVAATLLFAGCGIFLAIKLVCRMAAETLHSLREGKIQEARVASVASRVTVLLDDNFS
jgi:hypothetical protein